MKKSSLSFIIILLIPVSIFSQIFSGNFTTSFYQWESSFVQTGTEEIESSRHLKLYQSLNLKLTRLFGGRLSVFSNFRLNTDISGDDVSGNYHRLNTMYLSLRKIIKNTEIKFGRQFLYSNSISNPVDGIRIISNFKYFNIDVYGGILLPPDISFQLKSKNDGNVYGFSVYSDYLFDTFVKIGFTKKNLKRNSYLSVYSLNYVDYNTLIEENINFNASKSFKYFDLYGFLEFGLTKNDEGLPLIKRSSDLKRAIFTGTIRPLKDLSATIQYYFSKPRIYLNSIFAVFSQYNNKELSLSASYQLNSDVSLNAAYSKVYFDDISTNRYSIGGGWKNIYLSYYFNEDDLTELSGISGHISRNFKGFDIYGYVNYNKYDTDKIIKNIHDIYTYSIGIRKRISKNLLVEFTGINLENKLVSKDLRIFGQIRYNIFKRLNR